MIFIAVAKLILNYSPPTHTHINRINVAIQLNKPLCYPQASVQMICVFEILSAPMTK